MHRWEDNININIKVIRCEVVNLTHDFMNAVMDLRLHKKHGIF
jgi:hypothetical protein